MGYQLSKQSCIILGTICFILGITGVGFNGMIFSLYSPELWWRLLYALDVLFGLGGFIFALVFFGTSTRKR
ncbi:hypothetical protein LCGC14_0925870 [marine sediment metagenome]|uniref:Uncharacterized protein n=1 Tax=marine sediment metagenome TaxID=412755 RepID=A0A0F9PA97_9ZZZZ